MMEVPSYDHLGLFWPCVNLEADAYLVGVVRHVYDRGFTGWMNKVPEPENDDTFNEVMTEHIQNIELWTLNNIPVGILDIKT